MKISIIGQGYVGLTIAQVAAEHFDVVGFDKNIGVVHNLNQGVSHIEGVDSNSLRKLINLGRYKATSDESDLKDSEVVVIAVPTPLTNERKPDLSFIESACIDIGKNLQSPALIINESTSYPGTLRNYIKPMIEQFSPKKVEHLYAISPERVDPGRTDFNQRNTPRLYAGLTLDATKRVKDFYSYFCDSLIEVSCPEVAEAAKLFENTFRQVNIALVNEFAQITHALGISVHETINAAATKPYGFMKFSPSAGVGGHCIPIDPTYLAEVAEAHNVPATFIRRANEVNREMAEYVVNRVESEVSQGLRGKNVLIVGVAYKPNIADTRETAAELVIEHLRSRGANVAWHDDLVSEWRGETSSPLLGADITIVLTKHDVVSETQIHQSAPYVFDTTGTIIGCHGF